MLLQLIFQIHREIYLGERDRKKLVVIDEAWDLLREGEVSIFMEHAYRKFRKYGASAIIATQSIDDLYGNSVGKAIAANSANMLLLGQKNETIELVKEKKQLVLSGAGFNLLRSVHTEAGVYSGIFLHTETGQGVGRLVVSDFQKLLYSTNPVDVQTIKEKQAAGLSVQEAIYAACVIGAHWICRRTRSALRRSSWASDGGGFHYSGRLEGGQDGLVRVGEGMKKTRQFGRKHSKSLFFLKTL